MNTRLVKLICLAAVLIYIVSPVDALPGPMDDLIVMLMGLAANQRLSRTA